MGNAATIDIRGNNQPLKKDLDQSENLISAFGSKVLAAFAAIGATLAAKKIFDIGFGLGKQFLSDAAEAEEAQATLDAVLNATGHAAGFQTEQLVALAGQLQATTKFSDEMVMSAEAVLASFRNIRGDNFIEATRAIADMSTVMKTDLSSAALQVGKALNDPLQGMTALTRAGVTFTDSQKEMINSLIKTGDVMGAQKVILDELKHEFGGAAEEVGNTFGGQMERMKNRFGEISESLGRALMPAVEAFAPLVEAVATFTENAVPAFAFGISELIRRGRTLVTMLQPVWTTLVDSAIASFTMIQFVLENFGDISQRVMLGFQLAIFQTYEIVKHWLGTVIPDLMVWFAANWQNIFLDIEKFTSQVLSNLSLNIANFISAVVTSLKTGNGLNFKFTALTEGFESSIKELPKIAERVISGEESVLTKAVAGLDAKLSFGLLTGFAKNKADVDEFFANMFRKSEEIVDLSNTADKNFNPDDFTTKEDKKEKEKKDKKEKEKKEKLSEFVALEELNKRIQAAALKSLDEQKKDALEKKKAEDELSEAEKENLFGGLGNKKKSPFRKSSEPDLILKSDTAKALERLPQNDLEVIAALESKNEPIQKQNDLLQAIADSQRTMVELLGEQSAHQEKLVEQNDDLLVVIPDVGALK